MLGISDQVSSSDVKVNIAYISIIQNDLHKDTIKWIHDTRTTNHMTFRLDNLYNTTKIKNSLTK